MQAKQSAREFPYDGYWANASWTNGTHTLAGCYEGYWGEIPVDDGCNSSSATKLPEGFLRVNGTWTNGTRSLQWGVDQRIRHDILHGSWHVMTAIAISIAGHSLVMGLSGRLDQPEMRFHWGELTAAIAGWILVILNVSFTAMDVEPINLLYAYLVVCAVSVPVQCVALHSQVRLHNELVAAGLPLSKRRMQVMGMRCPRFLKRDYHPIEMARDSIIGMDPWRVQEDMKAEAILAGGIMPPVRYGSVKMTNEQRRASLEGAAAKSLEAAFKEEESFMNGHAAEHGLVGDDGHGGDDGSTGGSRQTEMREIRVVHPPSVRFELGPEINI